MKAHRDGGATDDADVGVRLRSDEDPDEFVEGAEDVVPVEGDQLDALELAFREEHPVAAE